MATKRKYNKTSPKWGKPVAVVPTATTRTKTLATNSRLDNYISDLEEMTGHKFKPSEILRLVSSLKLK